MRKGANIGFHVVTHQLVYLLPYKNIYDSFTEPYKNLSLVYKVIYLSTGNVYPAPLRQAPPTPPPRPLSGGAPSMPPPAGDRTEFRMHGMKGPHSYQFGYDTGKG